MDRVLHSQKGLNRRRPVNSGGMSVRIGCMADLLVEEVAVHGKGALFGKLLVDSIPSDAVRVPLVADVCLREEQEAQDGHLGQTFTSRGAEFKAS